jgi:hypothetical protein
MFDVICPRHGHRVLLFGSQLRLVNTSQGIEVHWTCSCGATGVERVGALAPHAATTAPSEPAPSEPLPTEPAASRSADADAAHVGSAA